MNLNRWGWKDDAHGCRSGSTQINLGLNVFDSGSLGGDPFAFSSDLLASRSLLLLYNAGRARGLTCVIAC